MERIRFMTFAIVGLLLALVVAACGSNSGSGGAYGGVGVGAAQSPTSTATAAPSPTSTSSSSSCGRYCTSPTSTPTSTGSATSIKSASVSVTGTMETVLTDAQGKTLYYRTTDTATSVCSAGCAAAWPPVLSTTVPANPSGFTGKLTVITDANGSQLAYNGHPLYTYAGDSGPGQANGQNAAGIWFVVTPALTA